MTIFIIGEIITEDLPDADPSPLLKSRPDFIYYCMFSASKVPVLMLLAGEDNVVQNTACQEVAKKGAIPDAVKVVIYPGAQHGFDMSELPPKMNYAFGREGISRRCQ